MHPSSRDLCRRFVKQYLDPAKPMKIADVGSCNVNGCYRPLFDVSEAENWEYTGFDVESGQNVDVTLFGAENWQLADEHIEAYDVVISGQVMEHVTRPFDWMRNVASLAKPQALIWVCAPNNWPFHEHPIDCWRVWPDGMRATFEDAGIHVLDCDKVGHDTFGIGTKL